MALGNGAGIVSEKTILITGGNAGIGRAAAIALAAGAGRIVITARRPERGEEAVAAIRAGSGNHDVEWLLLDLARFSSIHACAASFLERFERLDVLINNAGTILSQRRVTDDGLEATFQTNHLGHFLLTSLLLERLKASAPSRVVNVGSTTYRRMKNGLNFDDLQSESGYKGLPAYSASKLANVHFTRELARRLEGTGVSAYVVHPGGVNTEFGEDGDLTGLTARAFRLLKRLWMSADKGAEPIVRLATAADVGGASGDYFDRFERRDVSAVASDAAAARRLWEVSEALVGAGV